MNVDFPSRPHEHHVILQYVKTSTNFGYSYIVGGYVMNQNSIHNIEHSYQFHPVFLNSINDKRIIQWIESITHLKIQSIKKHHSTDAEDDDSVVFEVVFEGSDDVYTVIIKLGKKLLKDKIINQNTQNEYEKTVFDYRPSSYRNFKC